MYKFKHVPLKIKKSNSKDIVVVLSFVLFYFCLQL